MSYMSFAVEIFQFFLWSSVIPSALPWRGIPWPRPWWFASRSLPPGICCTASCRWRRHPERRKEWGSEVRTWWAIVIRLCMDIKVYNNKTMHNYAWYCRVDCIDWCQRSWCITPITLIFIVEILSMKTTTMNQTETEFITGVVATWSELKPEKRPVLWKWILNWLYIEYVFLDGLCSCSHKYGRVLYCMHPAKHHSSVCISQVSERSQAFWIP